MAFSHCFGSGHSSGLTDAGALEVELKDKSVPPSPPSCGLPVLIPMAMRVQTPMLNSALQNETYVTTLTDLFGRRRYDYLQWWVRTSLSSPETRIAAATA